MKYLVSIILFSMSLAAIAGGPKIKSISSSKEGGVKPGESATVTITLKGKAKLVKSMEFVVREFPYDVPPYELKAVEGKKNKVWTATIPVPFEAPAGTYHLELNVKLNDGSSLMTEDSKGNAHGKAGTVLVTVL